MFVSLGSSCASEARVVDGFAPVSSSAQTPVHSISGRRDAEVLAHATTSSCRDRARTEVIRMAKSSSRRVTSAGVARKASSALRDGRSSARTRSIAGSALSQAKSRKKG